MSSPVVTIGADDSIDKVVQIMASHHFTRIPVVRGKAPVGMIARNDLLKLMARKLAQQEQISDAAEERDSGE